MNIAQQWIAEGRVEGRAEGRACVLLRQLDLKFGGVSPAVRQRVLGASDVELERWTDAILSAGSFEDVFAF